MSDDQDLRKMEAERWWSFREQSIAHSKEYGIATIRALILINGAAILATLTFLSNLKNDSKAAIDFQGIKCSMAMFVAGLLLAILAGAMGYFNFQSNAYGAPGPNELHKYIKSGETAGWKNRTKALRYTSLAAVGLLAISFLLFALGSYVALFALGPK